MSSPAQSSNVLVLLFHPFVLDSVLAVAVVVIVVR